MVETVHAGGETETTGEGMSSVCKSTVALKDVWAYKCQHSPARNTWGKQSGTQRWTFFSAS